MDWPFLLSAAKRLLSALPLTLQLTGTSLCIGFTLALIVTTAASSQFRPFNWLAKLYVEVFRGTPLLVQIFLIYYGLVQIPQWRESFLWPYLSRPYWCAILALSLNSSAYGSEIIRGAIAAVPESEILAGRSVGMSGLLLRRRIIWPVALRYGLANYGNEAISILKATSLASVITVVEVTSIARKLIFATFRPMEIFIVTGAIYLSLTLFIAVGLYCLERYLNIEDPH